jgi:hypothetical protein
MKSMLTGLLSFALACLWGFAPSSEASVIAPDPKCPNPINAGQYADTLRFSGGLASADVKLHVAADGHVMDTSILQSSGHPRIDGDAKAFLERCIFVARRFDFTLNMRYVADVSKGAAGVTFFVMPGQGNSDSK